jgi:hypothetical protein
MVGTPYYLEKYNSIDEALVAVNNIVNGQIKRNQAYYVDNDFYHNEYPCLFGHCRYLCIVSREVTSYEKVVSKYSTTKSKKDNILYYNFRK